MGLFEFIIIIVLIASGFEMVTKIGVALARQLGARRRDAGTAGAVESGSVRAEAIEELEQRLVRIEDRLDFLEELKSPPERPLLSRDSPAAEAPDRRPARG